MINIDEINKRYNTSIHYITRSQLEEELLKTFRSYGYHYYTYEGTDNYSLGVQLEWEAYEYEVNACTDMDDAISQLFIKYCDDLRFIKIIKELDTVPF